MLRILEIAWMSIALVTGGITAYLLLTGQFSESVFMLVCSLISAVMYLVRRKQRIRYDQVRNKDGGESIYH